MSDLISRSEEIWKPIPEYEGIYEVSNLGNIKKIVPDDEKTTIQFLNDEQINVDATYNIIRNQYFKSLSLDNALKNRKKDK